VGKVVGLGNLNELVRMNSFKVFKIHATLAGAMMLSACDYGFTSSHSGSSVVTPPTNNSIVATSSAADGAQVAVGSRAVVSVTFTTNDGRPATNLSVTSGLSALPKEWTGPASFTCARVSTGNGCMLDFAYAPTALENGSLTLNFSYTNNAGASKTGTVTLTYASTEHNNVVATAAPAGQVAAIVGAQSTVSITFTTDDGRNASLLSVDTSTLPSGWSASASVFTCATVNTGSSCVLNLTYSPTAAGGGTAKLSYTYNDGGGTARFGSIDIPYLATTQNNVVATQTPVGQVEAVIGGSQTVKIDFTTDDTQPASGLTPADLAALPPGWTGPASFSCATVTTGNGCELSLNYQPTQVGSGAIALHFAYSNNSGTAKTGTVNIAYVAGSDNTIVGTPSPSGTINAIVGTGGQTVTVTFNSNDGNPGSNLSMTSGLGTLPAGWSGPASFSCISVNTGNGCQLVLTYNPPSAATGALQLQYSYQANSGAVKAGSVTIPYAATTHNNLIATTAPSGSIGAVVNGGAKPVTVTFTTDDGNPASAIAITSGLTTLPAGWTGPGSFTCATASTGTGCQLALSYAPTVNGSGTVSLGYSYHDDSGTLKTGTANIDYASIPGFLYITDTVANVLRCAISAADGSLSSCSTVASGLNAPVGLAFSGNWAYVSPGAAATDVDVCPVAADGSLGACSSAHTFSLPNALAVSGGRLYISDANGPGYVHSCDINNINGSLSNCQDNAVGTIDTMDGIAVTATTAYIVDINGNHLTTCAVSPTDGTLSGCTQQSLNNTTPLGGNTPVAAPRSASVYGGNLYVGTHAAVLLFPIGANGAVTVPVLPATCVLAPGTSCTIDVVPQTPVASAVFNNGYAYISGNGNSGSGGVGVCKVEPNGLLDNCSTGASPGTPAYYGGLAVH
jgi:hypothetical protein